MCLSGSKNRHCLGTLWRCPPTAAAHISKSCVSGVWLTCIPRSGPASWGCGPKQPKKRVSETVSENFYPLIAVGQPCAPQNKLKSYNKRFMAPLAGFQLSAMPTNFQCLIRVPGTGLGSGIHPETFMDTAAPAPVRASSYSLVCCIV